MIYLRRKDFDIYGNLKSDYFKNKIVIIFIHANFCGYCRIAKPEFLKAEKINKKKNIVFCGIQADGSFEEKACEEIFEKILYNFQGFPDYAFFKNGRSLKNINLQSRSCEHILETLKKI